MDPYGHVLNEMEEAAATMDEIFPGPCDKPQTKKRSFRSCAFVGAGPCLHPVYTNSGPVFPEPGNHTPKQLVRHEGLEPPTR